MPSEKKERAGQRSAVFIAHQLTHQQSVCVRMDFVGEKRLPPELQRRKEDEVPPLGLEPRTYRLRVSL